MSGHLLLAPEWLGLSGLWLLDAKGKRKLTDAEEVGLSEELADRLEAWMDRFDSIYVEDSVVDSVFPSEAEQRQWEDEGAALARAIATELGPQWQVSQDLTGWLRKAEA